MIPKFNLAAVFALCRSWEGRAYHAFASEPRHLVTAAGLLRGAKGVFHSGDESIKAFAEHDIEYLCEGSQPKRRNSASYHPSHSANLLTIRPQSPPRQGVGLHPDRNQTARPI